MNNALLALAGAIVAVTGTLLAPILSQRVLARVQTEQFERQQRAADAQWLREQRVAEVEKRRACYVTANSGYRRHRIELMKYLWLVHKGEVTAQARADLEETRHAMHTAFAEAQMVASDAVLRELDAMTVTLAGAYSRTLLLEDGNPHPGWSFEEIQTELLQLGDHWKDMRGIMRADLGVDPEPAGS
ncbi:hypothetical protein OG365_23205 [Streptomyces sp. NBC_00853]|uniref:hypothetical protein n=2 Tax=unclassified Streptomyces TaxID=2593676 RepID=UPI0038735B1F|nr:hypothetical protein OG365_23205 [Streptomyces sp. NBC_00853]